MPQLIAMIIVVVGAMIYMFQTFGGTGDKIEGVAQKGSIITEINNIKDGVKIAAKSEQIAETAAGDAVNTLNALGNLSYFAQQINEQVVANATGQNAVTNTYYAISFGGGEKTAGGMTIQLVTQQGLIPGIFVDLGSGTLKDNAAFLEAQVAKDLEGIAYIDRAADSVGSASNTVKENSTGLESRVPERALTTGSTNLSDGKFIVYFKDFGADEVVK